MTDHAFNSIVITEMEDNNMIKTTVKVDGMMCGMCESHVNDAVRKAFHSNFMGLPSREAGTASVGTHIHSWQQ